MNGGNLPAGVIGGNQASQSGHVDNMYLDTTAERGVGQGQPNDHLTRYAPKTSDELKTASTFADWDTDVWSLKDGLYPALIAVNNSNSGDDFIDNEFGDPWDN